MKQMKMAIAVVMILVTLVCAKANAETVHGDMIGRWISTEEMNGVSYSCEYRFFEDGTYAYVDEAIQYQEQGNYSLQENCLIITREDGGVEIYRLDTIGYTFYDAEEEESPVFSREKPQNMMASANVF